MKRLITLAVALASVVTVAQAASLEIVQLEDGPNIIYAVYLLGVTEADQVTALSFSALPGGNSPFLNYSESGYGPSPDFNLLEAGDPASFTNAKLSLNAGPPFFGSGWGLVDGSALAPAPSGETGIGWAASTPGAFMEADPAFLANFMVPAGDIGSVFVEFAVAAGAPPIDPLMFYPPEPSTLIMASLGMIGLITMRRRRKCSQDVA